MIASRLRCVSEQVAPNHRPETERASKALSSPSLRSSFGAAERVTRIHGPSYHDGLRLHCQTPCHSQAQACTCLPCPCWSPRAAPLPTLAMSPDVAPPRRPLECMHNVPCQSTRLLAASTNNRYPTRAAREQQQPPTTPPTAKLPQPPHSSRFAAASLANMAHGICRLSCWPPRPAGQSARTHEARALLPPLSALSHAHACSVSEQMLGMGGSGTRACCCTAAERLGLRQRCASASHTSQRDQIHVLEISRHGRREKVDDALIDC